jgi:hypothetical protein
MAVYANVANGTIIEIFTPPNGIDMADCFHSSLTWVDVTGRNPPPQVGWTAMEMNGLWGMGPPVAPPISPVQQAQALLGTGVRIVSMSRPDLNGMYPIDAESRMNVMAEMISIGTNRSFTDGSIVFDMLDMEGNPHAFDIDHFRSYATAIGDFITSLKMVSAGKINDIPPQPLHII